MKHLFLIAIFSISIFAQDDRLDELPFDDEPLQKESKTYFAIAGGYTFNVGLVNVDEVNGLFNSLLGTDDINSTVFDEISSPIIMHGGGGFTGIPFWKNVRVGFEAWAGNSQTNEVTNTKEVGSTQIVTNSLGEMNIAITALHADYGFVIADNFALLAGLKFGWSRMNLIYSINEPVYNWDNLGANSLTMTELEKSWLFVAPQVSIEWAATEFLMFQLNASYQLNFDNPLLDELDRGWKINRTASLNNVPDELNLNNLNIRLGIYLGLFNF